MSEFQSKSISFTCDLIVLFNYDGYFSKCVPFYAYARFIYRYVQFHVYRVCRENFDTAHKKVDGIEMNIKVPYHLAIFAIIIEILIFEIVLMRARQEKRSSRSRYSPAQFIKRWLRVGEARREARHCSVPVIAAPASHRPASKNSRRWSLRTIAITI